MFLKNCAVCGKKNRASGPLTKFRETGNLKHLYRNELNKTCFSHDEVYSDSKDLGK